MKDTIIKGSGNSRLIKTVPNAPTLWPTHEALMQEWATNGLPIDLLGLVAAGVQQAGMDLNKSNMLTDATEQAIWGSAADRTPDAALQQLRSLITTAQNTANTANSNANNKLSCATGSYSGTGSYVTINTNGYPFFLVAGTTNPERALMCFRGFSYCVKGYFYPDTYSSVSFYNKSISMNTGGDLNAAGQTYPYLVLYR